MTPNLQTRLDNYYQEVTAVILARQNPITGLLPASTAINVHGNYTDAWVRDNVNSILAVWGLALAYRKLDSDQGRRYELEQSVVKLMRGLLFAMMQQAHKVEKFKVTQAALDALHAKYSTTTATTVVGDDQWGHLQLDATSLYILMLAQMTASGLAIIFTIDEVNFIQNLVYYIGRAYRTPDYGIWERGNKANHGKPELNASSVGMAKAALEAINGLDLFGVRGSQASVIHVLLDEIARTRTTLRSLLPRESSSKEVDGALLSVIGYPAFAVEDRALIERTRDNVISKLEGKYGCKRFLRDGHQTVIEDANRLHYEPWELKQFEHLECEWPLFFTYLMLDALFRGDRPEAESYYQKLQPLLIEKDGYQLLPELFFVPSSQIEAERDRPQSQTRMSNANLPLVWAQSLYLLGKLLKEELLAVGDIDPLGRHLKINTQASQGLPVVQIALLAEDTTLQAELATYGIETQTPIQIAPIQVRQADDLSKIYFHIGRNDKLKLTGRPIRRLRSLTTSRIFRIRGQAIAFLPSFLDQQQFYLTLDYHFLVSQIKAELVYIQRHWQHLGRPTMTLLLTHPMFETERREEIIAESPLLQLLKELQNGACNGVTIKIGKLNQLLITAATEPINYIHDFEFSESALTAIAPISCFLRTALDSSQPLSNTQEFLLESERDISQLLHRLTASQNLYEQIDLLETLTQLRGKEFDTRLHGEFLPIADLLNEVYTKAGQWRLWTIIRRAAGLMDKVDIGLGDAVTSILIRGKQIAVGKSYNEASLIVDPMPSADVMTKIEEFRSVDIRERSLTQEIIIYLSLLIKAEPELCNGLITLRVGYLILLITSELARELKVTQDEAYEHLMGLSPFTVKTRLRQVLVGYEDLNETLFSQESLQVKQKQPIKWTIPTDLNSTYLPETDWWQQRQRDGGLNRTPKGFYPKVWQIMQHCKGLVIGDKLDRRNRLDSEIILAEMTAGEKNFAIRIEHLLNKIQAPEYRQVNTEALIELAAIADQNPDLQIDDHIVFDVLIGHAVRLAWLDRHPEAMDDYDQQKGLAWRSFYETSPLVCATYISKALRFLMELAPKMATANT